MGYSTAFTGEFELAKKLSEDETNKLESLNRCDFSVLGDIPDQSLSGGQCQWVPTYDGCGLEWDGQEKFYDYVEWLELIIEHILKPGGHHVNGTVFWKGDDGDWDRGVIIVEDNEVTAKKLTVKLVDDDGVEYEE